MMEEQKDDPNRRGKGAVIRKVLRGGEQAANKGLAPKPLKNIKKFVSALKFAVKAKSKVVQKQKKVNNFFRNLVSRSPKDAPLSQALQNKEKAVDLFIQSTLGQYPRVINALIREPDRVISNPSAETVNLILGEAYKNGPTEEQLRSVSWVTRAYREFASALRTTRNAHHSANLNLLPASEIKSLKRQLDQQEMTYQDGADIQARRIAMLTKENKELKNQVAQLQIELKNLEQKLEAVHKEYAEKAKNLDQLDMVQAKLLEEQTARQNLQIQCDEHNLLLVESEKQCSELETMNEKIKSNLKKVKLQFATKLVDLRKLKTKNAGLTAEIAKKVEESSSLCNQVAKAELERDDFKTTCASLQKELEKSKKEIDNLNEQAGKLSRKVASANNKSQSLVEQIQNDSSETLIKMAGKLQAANKARKSSEKKSKRLESEKREQQIAHKEDLAKKLANQSRKLEEEFAKILESEKEAHEKNLQQTLAKDKEAHVEAQKALERVHERKMQELRSGFSVEKSSMESEISELQSQINGLKSKLKAANISKNDLKQQQRRESELNKQELMKIKKRLAEEQRNSVEAVKKQKKLNTNASTQMLVKELGRAINQALEKSKAMHEIPSDSNKAAGADGMTFVCPNCATINAVIRLQCRLCRCSRFPELDNLTGTEREQARQKRQDQWVNGLVQMYHQVLIDILDTEDGQLVVQREAQKEVSAAGRSLDEITREDLMKAERKIVSMLHTAAKLKGKRKFTEVFPATVLRRRSIRRSIKKNPDS